MKAQLTAPDAGQTAALAVLINRAVVDYCKSIGAADVDVRLLMEATIVVQSGYLSRLDAYPAFQLMNHAMFVLNASIKTARQAAMNEALDGAKSS